jgi:RNA polymerase sigma factor (sigma-70 family)
VEAFETYRPYLFAIAYRMLGSAMDAEDMVQETYLRSQATPKHAIHSLKAYFTTILVRLCMDQLQLARRKRERYVGPWLPEPIRTAEAAETGDPEKRVEMEESISLAFLVLLEQLQPFERAVFTARAESSRTSLLRLLAYLRRLKPPVAAPSAGRSNTWSTGGHASHQLPKRTGNCSPASWRQCAPLFCPEVVVDALTLDTHLIPQAMIPVGYAAADSKRRERLPLSSLVVRFD